MNCERKRFEIYKNTFYKNTLFSISTRRLVFLTLAQKTNARILTLCLNTLYQSELACSFNLWNSRRSSLRLWSSTFFLPFGFPDLIPNLPLERVARYLSARLHLIFNAPWGNCLQLVVLWNIAVVVSTKVVSKSRYETCLARVNGQREWSWIMICFARYVDRGTI